MALNPLNTIVPQPNVPFLDPNGNVSRSWFYFFVAILTRTGGTSGNSTAALQDQINALFVGEAMTDVADPTPPPSLPVLLSLSLADDVPSPSPTIPTLLALALGDDVPRTPLNPLLAALMVSI